MSLCKCNLETPRDFRVRRDAELRNGPSYQDLDQRLFLDGRCQITVMCDDDRKSLRGLLRCSDVTRSKASAASGGRI